MKNANAPVSRVSRWGLPVLLIAGFGASIACHYALDGYLQFILITLAVNIMLCASLNLVNGYLGEFSVGHAGFMAIGAYTSAIVTVKLFAFRGLAWPLSELAFLPAVLTGGAVAAIIGFPLAIISFKTRGDYLAIITFAFLMIVKSALENIPWVGGPRGFLGIQPLTSVPCAFLWTVFTIWVIRNLVFSRYGRAVIAIREDEIAANAMGVGTREAKIMAFVVSSFFAGAAGALAAHQILFINPGLFDILKSTEMLVMVYLGGIGSLGGSILGATLYTFLAQALVQLGVWRLVIIPLILVLLMLFRPRGIMGLKEFPWLIPRRQREEKQ